MIFPGQISQLFSQANLIWGNSKFFSKLKMPNITKSTFKSESHNTGNLRDSRARNYLNRHYPYFRLQFMFGPLCAALQILLLTSFLFDLGCSCMLYHGINIGRGWATHQGRKSPTLQSSNVKLWMEDKMVPKKQHTLKPCPNL